MQKNKKCTIFAEKNYKTVQRLQIDYKKKRKKQNSKSIEMKEFYKKQVVYLPRATIEKAKKFASDVIDTVNYEDSNQINRTKIKDDHFISKLGEEAVKKVFENLGKSVNGPDYTIYSQKQKSWAADLRVEGKDLAVKTMKKSAASKYGLSWTFQSSSFRRDSILDKPNAWVVFVEVDDTDPAKPCTVYSPCQMKELTLKDPVLQHLKGKKLVAYAKDLPL